MCRLVSAALFTEDDAEKSGEASSSAIIVHNGRKLVVSLEGDAEGLFEEGESHFSHFYLFIYFI